MDQIDINIRKHFDAMWKNLQHAAIRDHLDPVKIRKDGRVTVVFWKDGSTTAVRCGESEPYDDYTAFCAALAKKVYGSNSRLKRMLRDCPVDVVVKSADLND